MSIKRIERCFICGEAVPLDEAIYETKHQDFRHDNCYSGYIDIYREIDDYEKGLSKRNLKEVLDKVKEISMNHF